MQQTANNGKNMDYPLLNLRVDQPSPISFFSQNAYKLQ